MARKPRLFAPTPRWTIRGAPLRFIEEDGDLKPDQERLFPGAGELAN
jgi:hypothetical protein